MNSPKQSTLSILSGSTYAAITVFAILITLGITSRFLLADIPNFKPVAAIALFAAFYFQRFWVSAAAVLAVMLVSNFGLADCPWQITAGVIGGLLIASLLGRRLQQRVKANSASGSAGPKLVPFTTGVVGSAVLMSIAFFLVSNASVWFTGQWYPMTVEGLTNCYLAAIPFFRFTLASDLMFSGGLFAVYYATIALKERAASLVPVTA